VLRRRCRRSPGLLRLTLAAGIGLGAGAAFAAVPQLDHVFPVAIPSGATNSVPVTLVGKHDPWPPLFWTDHPELVLKAGTNANAVEVLVGPAVPPGPHLIRTFNSEGASAPRFLIVTPQPPVAEAEPNDHFGRPQVLTALPAEVNGRLEKSGDVDSYAVTVRPGHTLVVQVEALVLQSPVDAVLRVVDPRGVEVAFNHDDGRTLDPALTFTPATGGTYVVQVFGFPHPANSDIQFTGNAKCVYRLHVTDGPWLSHTLPFGLTRGTTNRPVAQGWNLPAPLPALNLTPFDPARPTVTATLADGTHAWDVPLGDGPEVLELEPNDASAQAQSLPIPGAVTGTVERDPDVDRYSVEVPADGAWELEIQSASLGFPLEARLRIEDSAGKVVAQADSGALGDPTLLWKPPAAGRYGVVVDSVIHRGGPRHLYRLAIRRPQPGFVATLPDSGLVLEPGHTNELKVSVTRQHGLTNSLPVRWVGLPPGVNSPAVEVPASAKEAVLKLVTETNAPPFQGLVRLEVVGPSGVQRATFPLISGGENNGVPQGFKHLVIEQVDHLWLTVKPATNAAPVPPPAKP
jgi:hypothetical protein